MTDYFLRDTSIQHEAFERKWSGKKYMKSILHMRQFVTRWDGHPRLEQFKSGAYPSLSWEIKKRGPLQMDIVKEQRKRARARAPK